MSTLRFDSTDLGRTEEFLSRAYTRMSIGGRADRTRTQVARVTMDALSFDDLAFDYDMSHRVAAPLGKVCLCTVHRGGIIRQYFPDGIEGTFGPGDTFMYTPHDRLYTGVIRSASYSLVMFDHRLLGRVADTGRGGEIEAVRLTSDRPVSRAAGQQLRSTVAYLRDHVLADPDARTAPLVASSACQLLAATVLNAFPSNALTEPTARDHRDGHPAAMRRALAYIDDHAAEPVTLADIAAAAGTTGRAVQAAFRRHRDTTPMGYLRQVRLDAAHHDLQATDAASGVTVAEIARRWGFAKPTRFAAYYRKQFGVPPSRTLRT